jgi:phosphatidylinositol alpha-1,6-mannosyltransferase
MPMALEVERGAWIIAMPSDWALMKMTIIDRMATSYRNGFAAAEESAAARQVLLLAPSRGLGGGIERYLETLEWALKARGASCQRVNLDRAGLRGQKAMLAAGRTALRETSDPARLILGHMGLLPVATLLARGPGVCGIWVVCHGSEVWSARLRPRRMIERALMRRPNVNVLAGSSFTAGALAVDCQATILPPALSRAWFETLVAAGSARSCAASTSPDVHLVTSFRLAAWREKGLPQVIDAVCSLRRPDIRLTICGGGKPPPDLLRLVASHSWCTLLVDLSDGELAREFAAADLFVLASRTNGSFSGEGFGLVLLEAQVAGTPVIAPAYGGSSDAYVEGITGLAPVDETARALAGVLGEMVADPARLAWMGKRAADWARESFAPERYAQLVARKLL